MSAFVLVKASRHIKQEFDMFIELAWFPSSSKRPVQGTYLDHIERHGKTNHAVVSWELFLVVVSFTATK